MGFTIVGYTKCPLCNKNVRGEDDLMYFPSIHDSSNRFNLFSGATVHRECLKSYNLVEDLYKYMKIVIDIETPIGQMILNDLEITTQTKNSTS